MICNRCPRKCNAERTETANPNGVCQMPLLPRVARASLHFGEEPCISGTNGSGTVFFSGCSLGCVYCQNGEISHQNIGYDLTANQLTELFKRLEEQGAHNINLVNPTHFSHALLKAFDRYRPKIPIVWNSGGYDSETVLSECRDFIDIYLMDLKYSSPEKAKRYSNAGDYPSVAQNAVLTAYRNQPNCEFDENGLMKRGLIVRHLILPQATKEAIACFDWVRQNVPNAYFSIMSQYVPCYKSDTFPEINRKVTKREVEKVLSYICEFDFQNVFYQENGCADESFIPDFSPENNIDLCRL